MSFKLDSLFTDERYLSMKKKTAITQLQIIAKSVFSKLIELERPSCDILKKDFRFYGENSIFCDYLIIHLIPYY